MRYIVKKGGELYHYGVPGMQWADNLLKYGRRLTSKEYQEMLRKKMGTAYSTARKNAIGAYNKTKENYKNFRNSDVMSYGKTFKKTGQGTFKHQTNAGLMSQIGKSINDRKKLSYQLRRRALKKLHDSNIYSMVPEKKSNKQRKKEAELNAKYKNAYEIKVDRSKRRLVNGEEKSSHTDELNLNKIHEERSKNKKTQTNMRSGKTKMIYSKSIPEERGLDLNTVKSIQRDNQFMANRKKQVKKDHFDKSFAGKSIKALNGFYKDASDKFNKAYGKAKAKGNVKITNAKIRAAMKLLPGYAKMRNSNPYKIAKATVSGGFKNPVKMYKGYKKGKKTVENIKSTRATIKRKADNEIKRKRQEAAKRKTLNSRVRTKYGQR